MSDCHCHTCQLDKIITQLTTQGEYLMTLQDDLNAIITQLGKAKTEILAKLTELEAQLAAGEVDPQLLTQLRTAAQALDDVVPDQPA